MMTSVWLPKTGLRAVLIATGEMELRDIHTDEHVGTATCYDGRWEGRRDGKRDLVYKAESLPLLMKEMAR